MGDQPGLDIIKGAILLERKGKAFYEVTAQNTQSEAVREIFETMAAEEQKHIEVLSRQYHRLMNSGQLGSERYEGSHGWINAAVLTKKVSDQISAASYEAAAITAAMAMEENAVKFYSQSAQTATHPLEKELFDWLANWEKTHLQFLYDLDHALKESVWYDNRFWPMA